MEAKKILENQESPVQRFAEGLREAPEVAASPEARKSYHEAVNDPG